MLQHDRPDAKSQFDVFRLLVRVSLKVRYPERGLLDLCGSLEVAPGSILVAGEAEIGQETEEE